LTLDVDEALVFLTLDVDEAFLFLFLGTTLSTALFGGKTIPTAGVDTTMLVSVLDAAGFFCLFFGWPLQVV
jgi:hypothetical protein